MTIFCQIKLIGSGSELWSRISDKTIRVRADLDSQFWSICIPKNSPFEALIKFKIPQKLPNGINLVPWQDPVARLACRKQPLRPVLQIPVWFRPAPLHAGYDDDSPRSVPWQDPVARLTCRKQLLRRQTTEKSRAIVWVWKTVKQKN